MELKISEATQAIIEERQAEASAVRSQLNAFDKVTNDILNVAFFEAFIDPNKVTDLKMTGNVLTFNYEKAIQENESGQDSDKPDSEGDT